MRQSSRSPYVAVVSPYEYARAGRLADELEALGYETILIDTPRKAERAADADVCVVVLTPDGWRDPAIVAVMRERPPALIPVLAAPMDVPNAPWSDEPIPMRGSSRAVAEAVADAVDAAMRAARANGARSRPGASYPPEGARSSRPRYDDTGRGASYPPETSRTSRPRPPYPEDERGTARTSRPRPPYPDGGSRGSFPPGGMGGPGLNAFGEPVQLGAADAAAAKKKGKPGRVVLIVGLVIVLLGGLGYAGYRFRNKLFPHATTAAALPKPYSAAAPGPGCDKGTGQWSLAASHTYFTTTCSATGIAVKQTATSAYSPTVYFKGTGQGLPQSYSVQVAATITSGDALSGVGLLVHGQAAGGGHIFLALENTAWGFAVLSGDNKGTVGKRRGFFAAPTKVLTLLVEVVGPTMTFTINGKQVTHLTEPSFSSSDDLGFYIDSADGKLMSATFSNFVYTPLPDPTISSDDAVSTAIAINNALPNPYTAAVPGPGCDTGGGQWALPSVYGETGGKSTCTASALQIQANAGAGIETGFYGEHGYLPSNYTVAVTMNPADANSCGGVTTHDSTGAYIYVLCANGAYVILDGSLGGSQANILASGSIGSAAPFKISIVEKGNTHTLTVNGNALPAVTNSAITTTDHISLFALGISGNPSTVAFASFAFTGQ
jgi:hypothetical protein